MKELFQRSKIMFTGTGFWISFMAVLFLCMLNTSLIAFKNIGLDVSQVWKVPYAFILFGLDTTWGGMILEYTYIFLLLLPFCFFYIKENKLNMVHCIQMRLGIRRYHYGNLLFSFIGAFLIFFVPFVIEIGINQIVFETRHIHTFNYTSMASISGYIYGKAIPFKWLYINHIQLYNILYAFFFAAMSGLMSMFVYSISYYVKQYAIVLVLPLFVLGQVQNKVNLISEELFGKEIQFLTSEYLTVNGRRGLCVWYILGLAAVFLIVSVLIIERQCRKDQL